MAKQLSLFGENPKEVCPEKNGGFCDFLPPELHDFGRPGRLTLIIAEDRQLNNDFMRYLAALGGNDWEDPYYWGGENGWLSLVRTNKINTTGSYPRPISLITETKRIKLLTDDCHFSGCARLRPAYNAFLNFGEREPDIDADIFMVDRATNYMKNDSLESMRKVHGISIVGNFLVTRKH